MLRINEVVSMDGKLYRILSIMTGAVVWIRIDDDSAFPAQILTSELENAIDEEVLMRVADPYAELAHLTSEEGSITREKRNKNYELIKPLIDDQNCYDSQTRSAIITKIINEKGSTKQTLYRLIRRYWQRGQTPNALVPDYKNSGGKGEKRTATDAKLGRPRKYAPGKGALIDANIERLFRIAINKYLLKDKGNSFPYAYRRFKALYESYFPETPEPEIPSNWQMMYFYKREFGQVERIQKRTNRIEYNKDIAPLYATANTQALGPGSRYEIDATIADIYLVSDSDRRNIVGRPIVYMVIDVFSRMIAGFYIGFENPSYVAAMQVLVMAMISKVNYCKSWGVEINEKDWPSIGLPDAILADKGELLGYQIETLESNFSVRIENTAPYRGDAKGIVERNFRTIQAEFKPFAPGVVTGNTVKKRGGSDYRLDAKLTIRDFTEIILGAVLVHNQYDTLTKYDREIDMPADLTMTPLSIWNWGVQHRTGRLRIASEDALRVSLLPRVKATFSDLGVCAFGVYYTSQEILQKGWLHRSKETVRPVSLDAAYDPACADNIYLFPFKNKTEYWTCNLAQRSREFTGCSFWDVWLAQEGQKKSIANSKLISEKKRRDFESVVQSKIKEAVKQAPETGHMTRSERISSIRENRNQVRNIERQESEHSTVSAQNGTIAEIIPLTRQQPDEYRFPDHVDELFDHEED